MKCRATIVLVLLAGALVLNKASAQSTTPNPQPFHRPSPPLSVKVGEKVFKIKLVPLIYFPDDEGYFDGWTCDSAAVLANECEAKDLWTILVQERLPLPREREVVIHELLHAICGTEKSNRTTTYHKLITILAPWLMRVWHDNPALVDYLVATEDVAAENPTKDLLEDPKGIVSRRSVFVGQALETIPLLP
jgi:hypothetical protein